MEVSYKAPRPAGGKTGVTAEEGDQVEKVSFVTKVDDQICGVGFYKYPGSDENRLHLGAGGVWLVVGCYGTLVASMSASTPKPTLIGQDT